MIEILNINVYDTIYTYVKYKHGPYTIMVSNNKLGEIYIWYKDLTTKVGRNHKEYEQFLKLDLELNELYKGEEL